MSIIYVPKGKALEYAPLAANLYKGCSHGCKYCYAPSATYTDRVTFHTNPTPRKNVLSELEKDASKLANDPREVLLCFTTDPYQSENNVYKITGDAIRILNENGLAVTILTKGGSRAIDDFPLLRKNPRNCFATTLTFDDITQSNQWEPNASSPENRIDTIQFANRLGIKTWVSFEPVIDPEAVYRMIERTKDFVDLYKVGKLNHHPLAKTIDWVSFRNRVVDLLEKHNKPYLIKRDLLAA